MEGRRVRFVFLIPVLLLTFMAQKTRSQKNNPAEEKVAAAQSGSKSRAKSLSPAASACVDSTQALAAGDRLFALLSRQHKAAAKAGQRARRPPRAPRGNPRSAK